MKGSGRHEVEAPPGAGAHRAAGPVLARGALLLCGATLAASCGSTTAGHRVEAAELRPLEVTIEELGGHEEEPLATEEAEIVARDVAAHRARAHGELPPVERTSEAAASAWPTVTVRNDTPHGLVVWFAGPCARTVALPSHNAASIELCAGRYDIAARLAAPGYMPFVGQGDEIEDGSTYRLTFYVVVAPRTRTIEVRGGRHR